MSSDWPVVTLQDITTILGDGLHGTPKYDELGDYYFINGNNLNNGRIVITDKTKRASRKEYEKYKKDFNDRTILVSINGTLGNIAFYNGEKVFPGKSACYFNVEQTVDKHFVRYVLESRVFQNYIHNLATGSTIKNVSLKLMREFSFKLPPAKIQTSISSILKSLDEKNQLNQNINQTLEQMAQAIFKSWFVDFEPVKAKIAALEAGGSEDDALLAAMQAIAGSALFATDVADADAQTQLARLQTEHPEQYATLRATAELFPSAMQESELGEIPEGWRASKLSDEFDVTMGQSPPGHTYNEAGDGVPFFQGRRDFGVRYPSNRVYCTEPKRMAKAEDTLLSVRAPVGDTNLARTDCCIGRGIAALRHKSGCSSFTYYSVIQLGQALSSYDSEGTVFGSINQKNLNSLLVIAPSKEILSVFSQIVGATDSRIKSLSEEVSTLAELRDTLLPKLLSGELSLAAAEEQLADTVEPAHV